MLQPKFSASRFWEVVVEHGVTHISLIPFVFKALGRSAERPEHTLQVGVFGLIMPELDQWLGVRGLRGLRHDRDRHPRDTGKPLRALARAARWASRRRATSSSIVDQETGELCAEGETGELWVRGTRGIQLFLEYYDNPEANAKSFTEDGWFKTGDMVTLGAGGNFFYNERDKDAAQGRRRERLGPRGRGRCTGQRHRRRQAVAVVGKKHEMLDQVAVAFVITRPGAPARTTSSASDHRRVHATSSPTSRCRAPSTSSTSSRPATLDKVAKNKLREQADEQPAID